MSSIPSGAIVEGEIVAGCINCPVAEARWAKSLSNHGAWAATLLSRKSCALTISYSFWPSGKCSIQQERMMDFGKEVEKVNKEHHSSLGENTSVGNHVLCME
jgi:hypothetical protein